MPRFALLSDLPHLSPDAIAQIDHIIADDGDWTPEQIAHYIAQWQTCERIDHEDDWTRQ